MISAVRNTMFNVTGNEPDPVKGPAEPSTPRALPTNGNGMGRDEFLKMLVAQLKNQDPLNPMDGKDMAAQLAQFSQVEQLIKLNESIDAQKAGQASMQAALEALQTTQNERSDELASLIEGQMAVATVGKTGVTTGDEVYVNRDGSGTVVVDTGTKKGTGRLTVLNDKGERVAQSTTPVGEGNQAIDLAAFKFDPPLEGGKYKYTFEVATDGDNYTSAKTYTVGRITGLRYEQGNPILIIGDKLSVPMSALTQIRG